LPDRESAGRPNANPARDRDADYPRGVSRPPVPIPPARWPTADEAARSRLYSPVRIGRACVAESRTWVPAMVPWRATEDGFVTADVIDWYGRFADGRPGVLVVEATGIRDVPSGPLLRIGHDRFVPLLKELVSEVRRRSGGHTRLFLQILDFLAIKRRPPKDKFFARFLDVTPALRERIAARTGDARWLGAPESELRAALASMSDADHDAILDARELESLRRGHRERVTDTHLPHIAELPRVLPGLFADAARRAEDAGFDGVELHYAHAYTMASFLSATNTRADGWGGPRENRVRLPLEVFSAVRARVSPEFVVGVRFLSDEVIAGGNRVDDAAWFGAAFARAGFDFLSLSKGGKFDDAADPAVGEAIYPYTGPSGAECMPTVRIDARGPFGRNAPLAAAVRKAVRDAGFETPVVATGGINSFELAEATLARGDADIVGAARQSLADPDWWEKMRTGRGAEIRRCLFTNYCEGLDQRHKQVTCQLWDRIGAGEPGVAMAADGRRRLLPPG
jgi:2,4-dienoyl-CoA reductase-like NADH-dependent reductase (Old Yellow Enzyme family)